MTCRRRFRGVEWRQPVHLLLRVAEDHRLGDGERVVEVAERVELPLLALHGHEEPLNESRLSRLSLRSRERYNMDSDRAMIILSNLY